MSEITPSSRVVVTWELAAGVASALWVLSWFRDAREQRSRVFESVLRDGLGAAKS